MKKKFGNLDYGMRADYRKGRVCFFVVESTFSAPNNLQVAVSAVLFQTTTSSAMIKCWFKILSSNSVLVSTLHPFPPPHLVASVLEVVPAPFLSSLPPSQVKVRVRNLNAHGHSTSTPLLPCSQCGIFKKKNKKQGAITLSPVISLLRAAKRVAQSEMPC